MWGSINVWNFGFSSSQVISSLQDCQGVLPEIGIMLFQVGRCQEPLQNPASTLQTCCHAPARGRRAQRRLSALDGASCVCTLFEAATDGRIRLQIPTEKNKCRPGDFPKLGDLFEGPIIRIVIYLGLYLGNYHLLPSARKRGWRSVHVRIRRFHGLLQWARGR